MKGPPPIGLPIECVLLVLEYVRPLPVNGLGPLSQQEQCVRLNNMKNTTQAVYVETSLLNGVKSRPVAQD